jgi:hypothetical protein
MEFETIKKLVSDGRVFSVDFIKKDGTLRSMLCRTGVTKHLQGGEKKYDTDSLEYLTVFDMQKQGYRTINTKTIVKMKVDGIIYNLEKGEIV